MGAEKPVDQLAPKTRHCADSHDEAIFDAPQA